MAAVEQGYNQQAIADEAYAKERRIASGEDVVVGVNAFRGRAGALTRAVRRTAGLGRTSSSGWQRLRAERDGGASAAALARLS